MNEIINTRNFRKKILPKVLMKLFLGYLLIGILIFLPAGTLKYINGWLFAAGLLIPMTFAMTYLLFRDPELLEKRVNLKEKEESQKKYVKFSILLFVIAYIIPGLDYRFQWSTVPMWLVVISLLFMLAGYLMFIVVMLQNRYASRVIEIQNEQKVIDTGLYSVVRHPMYLAATILYMASSLVLGSYFALIPMSVLPFLLAFRIINEEKVLMTGLPGYQEYTKKVKYKMIPHIW